MKKKLRILPPTMRIKQRYILFEILSEKNLFLEKKELQKELNNFFLMCFGFLGFSKTIAKIVESQQNRFILKTDRNSFKEIIAALQFLKELRGIKIVPTCLKISGTIKGVKEK